MFSHNPVHQVVVCYVCYSCIVPGRRSQERHLRAKPHRLSGDPLSTTVQLLSSYSLRTAHELKEYKPCLGDECQPIEHLACYDGFHCLQPEYEYCTRHPQKIREHVVSIHKLKAVSHRSSPLWKKYKLQTYFTRKGLIDYFVVVERQKKKGKHILDSSLLKETKKVLFEKLEQDYKDMKCDLEEQATIIQDIRDSRSERVLWLYDVTGFPYHNTMLKDEEIWSSYKLLPKKELDAGSEDTKDPNLVRILLAAKVVLRDAYRLCSDTSLDRKII
jgi:hypothetical protein